MQQYLVHTVLFPKQTPDALPSTPQFFCPLTRRRNRVEICQRAAMNAIRESVRHEIDLAYEAEERARIREEEGLEEEEEEEDEGPDPVPAITRAHFEVGAVRWGRAETRYNVKALPVLPVVSLAVGSIFVP